jgi:hypothetical protein
MVIVNSPCVFRVTDLGGHLTGLSATQGRYTVLKSVLAGSVKERACES